MGSDFISLIGPPWHEDKWYFIMFQIKKQNFVIWIPWMEEPGRLQSTGSLGVGHDWATSISLFTFHALEEEMATHSSVLAWRIPGTGEPGGLLSMESHRVRHDWSDLAAAAAAANKGAVQKTLRFSLLFFSVIYHSHHVSGIWFPGFQERGCCGFLVGGTQAHNSVLTT